MCVYDMLQPWWWWVLLIHAVASCTSRHRYHHRGHNDIYTLANLSLSAHNCIITVRENKSMQWISKQANAVNGSGLVKQMRVAEVNIKEKLSNRKKGLNKTKTKQKEEKTQKGYRREWHSEWWTRLWRGRKTASSKRRIKNWKRTKQKQKKKKINIWRELVRTASSTEIKLDHSVEKWPNLAAMSSHYCRPLSIVRVVQAIAIRWAQHFRQTIIYLWDMRLLKSHRHRHSISWTAEIALNWMVVWQRHRWVKTLAYR